MKPILFLLLTIIIFSCKKEKVLTLHEKVNGRWELSRRWGTIAGVDESYPPGNGAILQFTGNNFYQYSGAQLVQSGTFSITEDTTSYSIKGARITFNASNGSDFEKFIVIADTALTFNDYVADAEFTEYRRL